MKIEGEIKQKPILQTDTKPVEYSLVLRAEGRKKEIEMFWKVIIKTYNKAFNLTKTQGQSL